MSTEINSLPSSSAVWRAFNVCTGSGLFSAYRRIFVMISSGSRNSLDFVCGLCVSANIGSAIVLQVVSSICVVAGTQPVLSTIIRY